MPDEIADRYLEQQALDAARVPARTLKLLRDYLAISGAARPGARSRRRARRASTASSSRPPAATLRAHVEALAALLPRATITFDAAFSPRLDYYTGIVFEMTGRAGDRARLRRPVRPPAPAPRRDRTRRRLRLRRLDRPARGGGRMTLTLAVPSKGRLEELTRDFFAKAGLAITRPGGARSYAGALDGHPDVTVRFYPAERNRPRTDPRLDRSRRHRHRPHPRGSRERPRPGRPRQAARLRRGRSRRRRPRQLDRRHPDVRPQPTSPPTSATATAAGCASRPSTST